MDGAFEMSTACCISCMEHCSCHSCSTDRMRVIRMYVPSTGQLETLAWAVMPLELLRNWGCCSA